MTVQITKDKQAIKLAEIADELATEWLRFGNLKPEIVKRLQLAVDDFWEAVEE